MRQVRRDGRGDRASCECYGTQPRAVHVRELGRIRECHQVRARHQQDARRLRVALVAHRFSHDDTEG